MPEAPSMWRQLGRGGKLTKHLKRTLIRVRMERDLDRRVRDEQNCLREAVKAGELAPGSENTEMNSAENLRKRFAMRAAPSIVEVLYEWWETALRSAVEGHVSAVGPEDYAIYLRPVFKALMDEYGAEEVEEAIAADWLADTRGEPLLTREHFCDSVFELADIHVPGMWRDQYVDFLWQLLEAVSYDRGAGLADMVVMRMSGNVWQPKRVFRHPDDVGRLGTFNPVEKPGRRPTLRRQRSARQLERLRAQHELL